MTPKTLAFTLIASLTLTACDGGDTTTVGPEGGAVTSRDGLFELNILPQALETDVDVSIESSDCGDLACYEIAPFGTKLGLPANVTYFYGEHDMTQKTVRELSLAVEKHDDWTSIADGELDDEVQLVSGSVTFFGRVAVTVQD